MIRVQIDIGPLTKRLDKIQKQQIPYALKNALNDTAFFVRKVEQVQMGIDFEKVSPFSKSGVQVVQATKAKPIADVFIEQKRLKYLKFEVSGGVRRPAGQALIIPSNETRSRNQRDLRPRLLARKGAFEATTRTGMHGIWQKRGKRSALKLLATYRPLAVYQSKYHFYEVGERTARALFPVKFAAALKQALATAR